MFTINVDFNNLDKVQNDLTDYNLKLEKAINDGILEFSEKLKNKLIENMITDGVDSKNLRNRINEWYLNFPSHLICHCCQTIMGEPVALPDGTLVERAHAKRSLEANGGSKARCWINRNRFFTAETLNVDPVVYAQHEIEEKLNELEKMIMPLLEQAEEEMTRLKRRMAQTAHHSPESQIPQSQTPLV